MKSYKKGSDVTNSENIEDEYPKILDLSTRCKFTDCTHTSENDCAVKEAISKGILLEETFHNYYREKKEAEHISKQKNKTKAIDYMKQRKLFQKFNK
jgi:putative ribosome biogenesis GTPase RsgA